ncbi:MAG: type VII secretion protein EssC [Firmicutes bacterium]|nr:type VII secretion protein EssC [Bacillota bacterium]
MIVRLIKKTQIYNFTLPTEVSGNYWITDNDYLGNIRNLINVEAENDKWKIKSDFETRIMSGDKEVESAYLKDYSLYFLKINTENEYVILYCSPTIDKSINRLKIEGNKEIIIGNDSKAHINYNYPLISKQHARLIYNNGKWVVQDLNSKYGTYVNNIAITSKPLEYGDIIFIMGLKIIVMESSIIVNNIGEFIKFDTNTFEKIAPTVQTQMEMDNPDEEGIEFFKEDDYFYRAPRFKTKIEDVRITIDPPPGKQEEEKMPAIYTIGPMMTMAMTSVGMGYSSLSGVIDGSRDLNQALPTLIMSFAMLSTMLLWPLLSKRYQKRLQKKKEELRQNKYTEYINGKREEIASEMKIQRQILIDNYLPLDATKSIIDSKKRNLWEREIDQSDFLDLRLGIGSTELKGTISFPEEHFALEDDNLLKEVYKLGAESRILENVPISTSFVERNITAIIGNGSNKQKFIEGLILQMITYHSYEDLKIIMLTNEKNESTWDYLKVLPHCWSNDKTTRYFAANIDEAKEISLYLEQEIQHRKYKDNNGKMELNTDDYHKYKPYYVIITDDYKSVRDVELIKDVTGMQINIGFSLIVISPRLINIPNECNTFISIGDKKSGIFENELVSNKQKEFLADYDPNINMYDCCKILANIPIDIAKEDRNLPDSISFLEMYNVGMIEQLNILNRWKSNDPTKSLQASVGVDKSHELFKLDLHEKFYGPHGLIAGMTGSGKSEFIISYVLSMAINYHPSEVSFVLIDYKGGGLTGAFENKETGMKLPHLAGTITNLDTVEMNRALASIESELRRRQRVFNIARDKLNESTIDIYKYQALYRKGLVDEPVSHLFIISDEFAELKTQQPEFMDKLISTARIGRSLGVHLILATQKPAGVVNDQIWSNSKFRVCLKVQDKADSMDMIKCPDAASLKNPGRFYLQVGYNELFALGQAAWAGAQYYPTEKRKKKVDQSIEFLDNVGNHIKNLDTKDNNEAVESKGEEITNIVRYIVAEAKRENISIPQLWLDRIPNIIYIKDLKEKYNFLAEKNVINPIIGEYDDPDNQSQGVLTLPLSKEGNTIIYGSTGSGKELMLSSIVYSTITTHYADEINFYIMDFGAETLTMFKEAPHVGEILLANDEEKINNLFKTLVAIIEERKKLFVEYNGSYDFYINHGGIQIPMITVIINNYEGFMDTYPQYEDVVNQITRDCLKYGIVFIITTSGPNTLRYKLKQNFGQNLVLQFNDATDYSAVLSSVRNKQPSKVFGRGLVDLNGVFEFQTAYPYRQEQLTEYIKVVCRKLQDVCKTEAEKIPVLPQAVTFDTVEKYIGSITTIPVGIEKESLKTATINLIKSSCYNITGEDIDSNTIFIQGLIKVINKIENTNVLVMDSLSSLNKDSLKDIIYDTNTCTRTLKALNDLFNKVKVDSKMSPENLEAIPKTVCIINGINDLLNKITVEEKTSITNIIKEAKALGVFKFIIVDTIENIKSITYEEWYKNSFDLSEGIWIGNGISNQFTLRVTTNSRELREEIDAQFGYIIEKGKATQIKFIIDE